MTEPWWISLIKAALIVNLVMVAFAYTTWLERKLLGRMQNRYGPNRAGPFGLLQPFADLIKLVRKESFFPVAARDKLYIAAPIISRLWVAISRASRTIRSTSALGDFSAVASPAASTGPSGSSVSSVGGSTSASRVEVSMSVVLDGLLCDSSAEIHSSHEHAAQELPV